MDVFRSTVIASIQISQKGHKSFEMVENFGKVH